MVVLRKSAVATGDFGGTKLSLLLEKQHNRGQDGAGAAILSANPEPGETPYWIAKSASATPLTDVLGMIGKRSSVQTGLTGLTRLSGDMSPDPKNPVNLVNPVKRIVCYDFGVKTNILRSLASWAKVTVVPAKTPAEEVLKMKPDGVFLSNGPADPAAVTYAIENIKKLLGPLPIMGICLGHQLLSLACGAKTGRLKFGHHGCNHPVKNLATGHVEITSQNHNFAVLPETVPDCLEVTHINLNDNSIEGVRHKTLPAFSVQYHPESCPGPHDSKYLFDEFRKMVLAVQNV